MTGRPVQDPALPDLATASDLDARAIVVNRLIGQLPGELLGVADARHLVRVAALGAGATATAVGARWFVLAADGRQVALHLRPPDGPSRVGPPEPVLREQGPPGPWAFERVLELTLPAPGAPDDEIVRSVTRAVATAVAGLRGRPPGPGVLARAELTAAPVPADLTAADVGTVAELLPAVRYWASGRRLTRLVDAGAVRRQVSAAQLGFDRPGGELRYRALRAAGLVPDDVHAVLGTLRDPGLVRWRGDVRDLVVAATRPLGATGAPLGQGLATVTDPTGRRFTVEVVPGRPGSPLDARVAGSVITVTAAPGTIPAGTALAVALRPLLTRPGPAPAAPAPGAARLADAVTSLAADAQWRPDGGLRVTGPDGVGRDVPAEQVRALAADLAGVPADQARDVVAARLGLAGVSGTDSYVPGSGAHGTASDTARPDAVRAAVGAVLADPDRLTSAAAVPYRAAADGSVQWVTEAGTVFDLTWDVVPAGDVGPSTVVEGVERWPTAGYTVHPDGHVSLRISEQARLDGDPGAAHEIRRALATSWQRRPR
jgi:hypothetical protein